jgi:hypothetical protein
MSRNPLAPVTDYPTMLNRILWFTTAAALVATWLLRRHLPGLDRLLAEIDFAIAFGEDKLVPIPGGFLLPALAVGMLTRIYRLHAHVSDWLAIRECFDVDVVITELADQLDVDLSRWTREELVEHRHALMRKAFYPFVNGPEPLIDPQLVHQALDAWSWFWIGVEAALVFTLTGLALVAGGVYSAGLQTVGGTILAAAVGLPTMRSQCRRYAIAQVRAIVADPARAFPARNAFLELAGESATLRKAA